MRFKKINSNYVSELKIDYSPSSNNVARRDPYFIWADVTHRKGLLGVDENASSIPPTRDAPRPDGVRVLLEWKRPRAIAPNEEDPVSRLVRVSPLYPPDAIFATGELDWKCDDHKFCSGLTCFGAEGVEGFDLGSAVNFSSRPPPIIPYAQPSAGMAAAPNASAPSTGADPRPLTHISPLRSNVFWAGALAARAPAYSDRPEPPHVELTGNVIAIIDHGCAFANASFLDKDGKSRVAYFWDQDGRRTPDGRTPPYPWNRVYAHPSKTVYGGELRNTDIDRLMSAHRHGSVVDEAACYEELIYDVTRASSSHGTHIMSLAAGWPNPLDTAKVDPDEAGKASIIFVQLPREAVADTSGGSMNVFVLDALRYIELRTSPTANVVVNLSYGTFAGPHDGSSRLERAIDDLVLRRRAENEASKGGSFNVVVPAGNAYNSHCHAQVHVTAGAEQFLALSIDSDCRVDTFVELWYSGTSALDIALRAPGNDEWLDAVSVNTVAMWKDESSAVIEPTISIIHVGQVSSVPGPTGTTTDNHVVLIAINPTSSLKGGSGDSELLIPSNTRKNKSNESSARSLASGGIWDIRVRTTSVEPVVLHAWIERDDLVMGELRKGQQARFLAPLQADDQLPFEANQPVNKAMTLASFVTGRQTKVVGGVVADNLPNELGGGATNVNIAPYSSEGPRRNDTDPNLPTQFAMSDESWALPGVLAAGNIGIATARRSGTSVAVPIACREILNAAVAGSINSPSSFAKSSNAQPASPKRRRLVL